ncbi:MAG: SDR family oxidoreductase [Leptolyngbya sp. SIO1E4]|nr:SDR family oxidoreductase [Leptolyngbya sp. SIO1E4]
MERPPAGMPVSCLPQARPLYLVADDRGVAPLLAAKFATVGIATQVVSVAPADATHLVVLSGLNRCPTPQDVEREIFGLFSQLRNCAAALRAGGGLFVTVQDTGGAFAAHHCDGQQAWLGGLAAFAKTAGREWPQLAVKAIDVAFTDPETVAASLFEELMGGGPEREVGLGENRTTPSPIAVAAPLGRSPFNDGDVLVVSGGARGVAAECVLALAACQPLRLGLLGRSVLVEESRELARLADETALRQHFIASASGKATPMEINRQVSRIMASREVRSTLANLTALGCEARYKTVDVTQTAALEAALDSLRQDWGAIHGVIHAAGVLRDKAIADMTPDQFAIVFRTKVDGLRALLRVTQPDTLKLLCCFSSIAARVGNPGQLNYNVANTTLNAVCLAEKVRRPDCVVKSIGWGAWDGGMVTPALKRHFEAQGVDLIGRQTGARAFVAEVFAGADSAVEVLLTGALGRGFASLAGHIIHRENHGEKDV